MRVDYDPDDELVDEQADVQETPEFHVRHAGGVTMLEASKGIDWMSMFPSEPRNTPEANTPSLIDVPLLREPLEPSVSADPPPRQMMPVLPPARKRSPIVAIGVTACALCATATGLYIFLVSAYVEPSFVPPVPAKSLHFTMEALAPAVASAPTPTAAPPDSAARSGRGRVVPAARAPTAQPSPPPNRRTVTPSPTPAQVQAPPTPTPIPGPAITIEAPPPSSPTLPPLTIAAPPPGAVTTPRPTPTAVVSSPRPSPTSTSATETTAVRSTLDQYRAAYDSLRSEAVQAVWPSANTRALARAFDQIASQSVEFDSCGIQLNATGAEATCVGRVTFVPKVGGKVPRVEDRRWAFSLRRQNDRWIIDRVVSR